MFQRGNKWDYIYRISFQKFFTDFKLKYKFKINLKTLKNYRMVSNFRKQYFFIRTEYCHNDLFVRNLI